MTTKLMKEISDQQYKLNFLKMKQIIFEDKDLINGASTNFRRSPDSEMIRISGDGGEYYKELKMTTPQSILHDLQYKLKEVINLLEGDENDEKNMFEVIKAIETEIIEFHKKMELLEDKMNLIIKLLGQ
jgi:hypothetical protein